MHPATASAELTRLRGTVPDIPEGSAAARGIAGRDAAAAIGSASILRLRRWFSESIGCEPPERNRRCAQR